MVCDGYSDVQTLVGAYSMVAAGGISLSMMAYAFREDIAICVRGLLGRGRESQLVETADRVRRVEQDPVTR